MPPQLPPRSPSQASSDSSSTALNSTLVPRANTIHLTPHAVPNNPYGDFTGFQDLRTSSTQSLRPEEPAGPDQRTLLIVYIHGFLGNETSFRSFPAHLHSLLSMTLAESHVVHSKIYPRYKSRKNISFARDAFSNWLAPHESDATDVILIGHSLGGILGAEVVLIPSHSPGSHDAFQHRILGLIAFDTPFLGMHPGVVSTGIASLFRGAPDPAESPSAETTFSMEPLDITSGDPNFNPAYQNDVNLPVRSNKWERAWYFWNKHCGDLRQAAQSYVKSHLEFGGCLADYPGLRRRYDSIRALEDIDDLDNKPDQSGQFVRRVRFVNYYTASSGRIKERNSPVEEPTLTTETEMQLLKSDSNQHLSPVASGPETPRLSLEEHQSEKVVDKTHELILDLDNISALDTIEPRPEEEANPDEIIPASSSSITSIYDGLPPIPDDPSPPDELDTSQYTDSDALKLAQKDHARLTKTYERAKKDREKAIRDREKIVAKRERQIKKDEEKRIKIEKENEKREQRDKQKRHSTLNPEHEDRQTRHDARERSKDQEQKKRDRKFCSLPAKDQYGVRDPTWIRVYMEGMDEVVAHTSLFFVSDAYAKLVGDTAERIERWIQEDATTRVILEGG